VGAEISDGELVRLARDGDAVAFRLLVERHRPMVRSRAVRLCRDRQEVDDAVQETFLQAFVALGRLRNPDLFAAWLAAIVVNVCRGMRRPVQVELVDDWPERLHPVSADGLPSADDLDRADALRAAVAGLPAGQRRAIVLFYYADRPAGQIAASAGAAKASLHKARRGLREYLTAHRPDLVPSSAPAREAHMTHVRIAHAKPRPGRLSASRVLVVLADDAGHRALPIWMNAHDGRSLWHLSERPAAGPEAADGPGEPAEGEPATPPEPAMQTEATPEETTARLLRAVGAALTAVQVAELGPEVTAAQVQLSAAPGRQQVTVRLAEGLALALAAGAPVGVAGPLWDRLAVAVPGDDLLGPFLEREQAASATAAAGQAHRRRRYEPRNMSFAGGLENWNLGGSFLREASGSHWGDYTCAAGDGSAALWSAVPDPYGRAILRQEIFADDYRGRPVIVRAQLRTEDVTGHAGLFLRVASLAVLSRAPPAFDPGGDPRGDPGLRLVTAAGVQDWTGLEVTAEVPADAAVVTFGIFLAGSGRVEVRGAELAQG
jgi:RNA polymerase sigma-70 factor, ECF subfamily